MEATDLGPTAHLHRAALPGSIFVSLGPRFVRAYHRTFVSSPVGIALLAECNGRVVGFVVGTFDEAGHFHHVVREDLWSLVFPGAAGLLIRPVLLGRFVRTRLVRYLRGLVRLSRRRPWAPGDEAAPGPAGVLSHIAIDAAERGEGTGAVLLNAFVDTARARGARTLRLTAPAENEAVHRFYERAGWQRGSDRHDADGRSWTTYIRELR